MKGHPSFSMDPEPGPWSSPYRWVMLALLWFLYFSFGMITRSLYPLVTPILKDLEMSYSQMGLVMGSWQFTYIGAATFVGFLMDRWGMRKSLFLGATVMAFSTGLRCFSTSFGTFLPLVSLFGIGGLMISVGAPKTIAQWFRGKDRGTAVGIYMTGPWIGGAFVLTMTNRWVMPLSGNSWRVTFVVYGMMALTVAFLWLFMARDLENGGRSEGLGMRALFTRLILVRNIRIVLVSGVLALGTIHGLSSWLPKMLETKGFSPILAGYAATLPLLGGIPALLVLPRMIPAGRRGAALGIIALIAGASVWLLFTPGGIAMYAGLILYGITSSGLVPLLTLILMETPEVGPEHMGSASGLFFCISQIGGFTSPMLVGALADWTGGFLAGGCFVSVLCLAVFVMSRLIQETKAALTTGASDGTGKGLSAERP